jgi:hypothetical protein
LFMNQVIFRTRSFAIFVLLLSFAARPGFAHFPWLATDDEGRALLFFGESPADRVYHTPEAVAAAKVFARSEDSKPHEVKLEAVEEDEYIGRRSSEPLTKAAALETTCEYGLYHGMLLTYYARHLPGDEASAWKNLGESKDLKLQITPQVAKDEDAVTLTVAREGKPLEEAGVTLTDSAGEMHEGATDERGHVTFKNVAAGLVGATANVVDDVKGEVDGKPYHSAAYYATLTFQHGDKAARSASASKGALTGAPTELPEPLASFGGAVADGWLYIYGGHIGEEHAHSKDNLSQHFRRMPVAGGDWEELPMETPLQGLPLVAHDGKLYRVGGLSAQNAPGDDEVLHSVAEFSCYDPETKTWSTLPPLPEPRSSHDAVVIGDVLYVVGGWTLAGTSAGTWVDTAWSFNLAKPGQWTALPSPNFHRRALAVAHWNGKLIALGGMDEDRKISRRVDALDLEIGEWTKLAKLPGKGMDGFGAAACNAGGKLYASGTQESLYRLADDGSEWEAVVELAQPRFFHRLVPGEKGALLAVGGASEEGHVATIEELEPTRRPVLEQ